MNVFDWRAGLSPEQVRAAQCRDCHFRLLAGPGTGKTRTLIHHAMALVLDRRVDPDNILALTFTRVAAGQLARELHDALSPLGIDVPRVATLHSFALSQLLRNSGRVGSLPTPLRVADDWEERNIIQEDLKLALGLCIRDVRDLFERLSADWETLACESPAGRGIFPDARFLGAWREHRELYGYTLRSELVYQFKRALSQYPDLDVPPLGRVLVDEYQDLNPCDLAVVRQFAARGALLFVAGDDDQSIYGFRYAEPEGIRRFPGDYPDAQGAPLEVCHRCDRSILRLAEFVANLDPRRLQKATRPREDAAEGVTRLICCGNQVVEAGVVASACRQLINGGIAPEQILVLMRSDHQGHVSRPLSDALRAADVPVAEQGAGSPLDEPDGRRVLGLLRLLADSDDSLTWRTLVQLEDGVGVHTVGAVQQFCIGRAVRFHRGLQSVCGDPTILPRFGNRVAVAVAHIRARVEQLQRANGGLADIIRLAVQLTVDDGDRAALIQDYLLAIAEQTGSQSLEELLRALAVSLDSAEQQVVPGRVNLLTMHKAKGLTADAVIIVGAEEEFIPGRNAGEREGDERRLLYVSMTRARHYLFITYCLQRVGAQRFIGNPNGSVNRHLTPFLRDGPIAPERP